ncbi:MAG: acyl-CoA dehydrogenase family protein [Anaerolineales bacterium]|nr:acyl-CoA dehydrogenase family protein [Anaerolineales bacterium]
MLNFQMDEEQRMLAEAVERYARERVRKLFRDAEEERELPEDVLASGWELGLLPTAIPESFGGFGEHSSLTGAIALESFAWGDLATTLAIMTPNLVAVPLMLAGTDAQKEAHLPAFAGDKAPRVTAALTEPLIQFDPRDLKTTATQTEDGYRLQGTKVMVPLADEAELFLVYANEAGQTQAFLVPAGTPGLTVAAADKWMGIHALPTFRLTLDGVTVPAEARLGGEAGCDFDLILNHSRIALAAAAVGIARAGFEYARDYAKQRIQFGEPIAQRQSIAFMLAEMAMDVDSARLLVWEAAWKLDQGDDVTREVTVMKQFVDEMVLRVADQALQTLGGYGYIREYPVELWLRNARGFATFDGLCIY